jgi:hypothetical protein
VESQAMVEVGTQSTAFNPPQMKASPNAKSEREDNSKALLA